MWKHYWLYTLLSPFADVWIWRPRLLNLLISEVQVLVSAVVNRLCTVAPVFRLTPFGLKGCVQSHSCVHLCSLGGSWAQLSSVTLPITWGCKANRASMINWATCWWQLEYSEQHLLFMLPPIVLMYVWVLAISYKWNFHIQLYFVDYYSILSPYYCWTLAWSLYKCSHSGPLWRHFRFFFFSLGISSSVLDNLVLSSKTDRNSN